MAHEIRPRRESSSTARSRKVAPPDANSLVAEDNGHHATADGEAPAGTGMPPLSDELRDRGERPSYRGDERPAEREPSQRYRDREAGPTASRDRGDRDRDREASVTSLRDRLARVPEEDWSRYATQEGIKGLPETPPHHPGM